MKLNVPERIMIVNILPPQGNVLTLRLIYGLKMKLAFTQEDIVKFGLKEVDGMTSWNEVGLEAVEFDISGAEKEIIKKELAKKDKDGTLPIEYLSLYDKFM